MKHTVPHVICSGFINGTLTSWAFWFSNITRPLNGLGSIKGILECWAPYCCRLKNSYWIGFYLSSYPGTWCSPCSTLSFSYNFLTKWVGKYGRNSPAMGSTSSSQSSTDSIDVLWGRKETPARNRSFHFSQANCVSIVFLKFTVFHYAWCFPLSSI